jgi:hypothetical protein
LAEPDRGAEAVPEAANDASRGSAARTRAVGGGFWGRIRDSGWLGWLLLALVFAGAVLLVVAEFSTVSYRTIGIGACDNRIQAPEVCSTTGHSQHGYALLVIAVLALVMAWGAFVGRSRAAATAVLVLGVTVLGIALIGDLPDRTDTRGLEARYTDPRGHLGSGFKLELAGGVLLLLAGGLALLRPEPGAEPRPRRRRRAEAAEVEDGPVAAEPEPESGLTPLSELPPPVVEPPPPVVEESEAEAMAEPKPVDDEEPAAAAEPEPAPRSRPRPKSKAKARGKGAAKPRPKRGSTRKRPNH